jgi:hypothetical protein
LSGNVSLKPGDRVFIKSQSHPWVGYAGELIAFEEYGPGPPPLRWTGWRIKLDGWNGECYANADELMGPGRVDSIKMTGRRKAGKR